MKLYYDSPELKEEERNQKTKYDPYGKATIYTGKGNDGTWFTSDDVSSSTSSVKNPYTFTGRRLDTETGLMYFRNRYYSVDLGRFISRDALEYVDGWNLYRGYFAVNGMDAWGERSGNASPADKAAGYKELLRLESVINKLCDKCCEEIELVQKGKYEKFQEYDECGNVIFEWDEFIVPDPEITPVGPCTKKECKEEGAKIAKSIAGIWKLRYKVNSSKPDPWRGGFYCIDWAAEFYHAVHDTVALKCSTVEGGHTRVGSSDHWFVVITVCGGGKDCQIIVDHGFFREDPAHPKKMVRVRTDIPGPITTPAGGTQSAFRR